MLLVDHLAHERRSGKNPNPLNQITRMLVGGNIYSHLFTVGRNFFSESLQFLSQKRHDSMLSNGF